MHLCRLFLRLVAVCESGPPIFSPFHLCRWSAGNAIDDSDVYQVTIEARILSYLSTISQTQAKLIKARQPTKSKRLRLDQPRLLLIYERRNVSVMVT